jgi:hypothetical protein
VLHVLLASRVFAQTLALVLVVAAAFVWGAGPERASAATLAWLRLADLAYHAVFGPAVQLASTDIAHAAIDTVALAAFVIVALQANRIYPLWLAALQLLAVYAHIARDIAHAISPLGYAVMYIAPSYFQIILLACGIWLHRRRLRRVGSYRAWRRSSSPSPAPGRRIWPNG